MKQLIKKYLPDIIIILGIGVLSYNIFRPAEDFLEINLIDYHVEYKVLGILMISIGADIAIRRYFRKNK